MEKKKNSFKNILLEVLEQRFGKTLALQYLKIVMDNLSISDLSTCSEKEQEKVVLSIAYSLYAKIFNSEDAERERLLLFFRVFGPKKAIECLGGDMLMIQPIAFVYIVFGNQLGELIIQAAKKNFQQFDIARESSVKQIKFVQDIFTKMFPDIPNKIRDAIFWKLFLFFETGKISVNKNKKVMVEIVKENEDNANGGKENTFRNVMDFLYDADKSNIGLLSDGVIGDLLKNMNVSDSEQKIWLVKLKENIDKFVEEKLLSEKEIREKKKIERAIESLKTSTSEHTKQFASLKELLQAFIGDTDVNKILKQIDTKFGKNVEHMTEETRKQCMDFLVNDTVFAGFSDQKKIIIQDKIYALFFGRPS